MNKRVIAKMRLSESPDLDDFFNGSRIAEQVAGVTRGKVYDVQDKPEPGDIGDITFINDNGAEQKLWSFFFEPV